MFLPTRALFLSLLTLTSSALYSAEKSVTQAEKTTIQTEIDELKKARAKLEDSQTQKYPYPRSVFFPPKKTLIEFRDNRWYILAPTLGWMPAVDTFDPYAQIDQRIKELSTQQQ